MLNVQPWKPNPIQGYSALTYKEHKNIENSHILVGYTRIYCTSCSVVYKDTYKYGIQGYTVVTGMVYKDITGMVFKDIHAFTGNTKIYCARIYYTHR